MKLIYVVPVMFAAAAFLSGCQNMPKHEQNAELTQPPAAAAQQDTGTPSTVRPSTVNANATRVDFRVAQRAQAAGLSELKFPDGSLWYMPEPVLTRADLSRAEPRRTADGHPYVRFSFSPQGAQKLAAVSQQYAGKLLVLTLNNSLRSVYQLNQPLTQGVLDIGFASDEDAVNVVKTIAGE